MKGKIFVVGFGMGNRNNMTAEAEKAIVSANVVIGYTSYIKILKNIFPELNYMDTPMCKEEERCRLALDKACEGKNVALVSSGDSGIYGMAGIMLQIVQESEYDIEVEVISGVTAASAAAAVLGAPLTHDFAVISLSDLMTPLELIFRRIELAAQGDFVIAIYNPKSQKRTDYLRKASNIVLEYRNETTPVGLVRNCGRENQSYKISTLGNLENEYADMFTIVIIGNSSTYQKDGKMITPRGYNIGKNM